MFLHVCILLEIWFRLPLIATLQIHTFKNLPPSCLRLAICSNCKPECAQKGTRFLRVPYGYYCIIFNYAFYAGICAIFPPIQFCLFFFDIEFVLFGQNEIHHHHRFAPDFPAWPVTAPDIQRRQVYCNQ